ncbi:MAG: GxxExxY protein [Pseudomonadota bacterium]|nr:GxxExxY protein [Pseudomonadota bacterium]
MTRKARKENLPSPFATRQDNDTILHRELSYEIVAAAIQVWKTLGYGFLEKVYENAMVIELNNRDILCEQQISLQVQYSRHVVGNYIADIIVDHKITLELKSAKVIDGSHIAQTLNYLKATNTRLGIILNFGPNKMEYKRIIL